MSNTWRERAQGARSATIRHKANRPCRFTTAESVLCFPKRRRLAVYAKRVVKIDCLKLFPVDLSLVFLTPHPNKNPPLPQASLPTPPEFRPSSPTNNRLAPAFQYIMPMNTSGSEVKTQLITEYSLYRLTQAFPNFITTPMG